MGGITSAASVTTGNGLSGAGTVASPLTVAAPSFNSIGSYVWAKIQNNSSSTITSGNNYSPGTGDLQIMSSVVWSSGGIYTAVNNLSGTWRYMGATVTPSACVNQVAGIFVRVA